MKEIANELAAFIDKYKPMLQQTAEDKLVFKPSPSKWSKKEIIGHLVDSAQSNIRRFVVAQYEDKPHIVYDQDKWVTTVGYQQWNSSELIDLWYLINRQIVAVLNHTPPGMGERECLTQELHSIKWLASDYIKHLRHHVHQVLELEPVPYP